MRRWSLILVAVGAIAAMASFLPAQNAARPVEPQKWESRVLLLTDLPNDLDPMKQVAAIEAKFNASGQDGWEFCQIHNKVAIFKRPKT